MSVKVLDLENSLNELAHFAAASHALSIQIRDRTIPLQEAVSALHAAFLEREAEHAQAVKVLVEAGATASAVLIARTMLEGAACLYWVRTGNDPEARATKWYEFAAAEALKALDEHEEATKNLTNIYDLKRRAREQQAAKKKLNTHRWTVDESGKEWSSKRVLENFAGTDPYRQRVVYSMYQHHSAFTHWSPAAFPVDLEKQKAGEWKTVDLHEDFAAGVVEVAFASLDYVANNAAVHFGIRATKI